MSEHKKRSLGRRISFGLIALLVLVVALLFIGEIAVRIMGNAPWNPPDRLTQVEPGGSLFQPHPQLGYLSRPGIYQVNLDGKLDFQAFHDSRGYRIVETPRDTIERQDVWVLGCSFTYGWGVQGADVYVQQLQKRFPQYRFRNFGVPGYGTLHSWLQLEELLSQGQKPGLVILAYGAFHDQRNTVNRYWRKAIASQKVMEGLQYPYARLDENGQLDIGLMDLTYDPYPLMRISALSHYLENIANQKEDAKLNSQEVSLQLIRMISVESKKAGADFLLANIYRDGNTDNMLNRIKDKHIEVMDMALDPGQADLYILPDDAHPNAKGHQKYADQLTPWVQNWSAGK